MLVPQLPNNVLQALAASSMVCGYCKQPAKLAMTRPKSVQCPPFFLVDKTCQDAAHQAYLVTQVLTH
jgi:hypothetical protein